MSGIAATPTILVTGASGFVGACLCRHFARDARRVVAVHGPSRRRWRLTDGAPAGIEDVEVDLGSADAVRALVREVRPSVVLSCAAYGAYPHQNEPARVYRVNFDGVRHLLDACSELEGFGAFVQAGSSSEYGSNCTAPREDSAPVPDSDYAVSKVAASAFVQYAGKKRGLPAWVLRLSSVYGPYEDASRLVPRLLASARRGTYPPLVNPKVSRDFVFIDDVCKVFERVVERASSIAPGEIFNVGTGVCTTLEDIVGRVRALFRLTAAPAWGSMADRHWDHRDWYSNPKKAEEVLGWRATTTLDEGLAATARWMDENPAALSAAEANVVTGGA
ncbi:MAG: UDP-glucose 4-epimerase [Myxococcaceae bacterium]|nr:UDP-glucose 4-epimerase [Myxococcaceae bacterium]